MSTETAWLIEHSHDPRYGRESWYCGKDGFTIDSLMAVRFARKEDAVREIDRFEVSLAKKLIATEHKWIGDLTPEHKAIRRIAAILSECGFHYHHHEGWSADRIASLVCDMANEWKIKREQLERLRAELGFEKKRLEVLFENEKVLRKRDNDDHAIQLGNLRSAHNNLRELWKLIGESLREFGHEPTGEDQFVAKVHAALTELDKRRNQRTSDPNLLVEINSVIDDPTEDSEWIILHERLTQFLYATGERGLKNLLGTVTMLRDRLLDVGDEILRHQKCAPRDGCLQAISTDHVDCR
jgi:hypothetical protein